LQAALASRATRFKPLIAFGDLESGARTRVRVLSLAQTIGNAIAGGISGQDDTSGSTGDPIKDALRAGFDRAEANDTGLAGYAQFAGPGAAPPKDEGFFGWLGDEISSGWHALVQGGETLINDVTEAVGIGDVFTPASSDPSVETVTVTATRPDSGWNLNLADTQWARDLSSRINGSFRQFTPPSGYFAMYSETHYGPNQWLSASATVSNGRFDPGGVSYGAWQLASNAGQPQAFLNSPWGSPWASQFTGLDPTVRGGAFGTQWQLTALTGGADFFDAQRQFMVATHYDPVVAKVMDATGLDINAQSDGVREAVFSMATQHGRAADLVTQAVENLQGTISPSDSGYDVALVNELYDVRTSYALKYATPGNVAGILNRYSWERTQALRMTGH